MTTSRLIGLVLVAVGVLDPIVGLFLVAPRVADPARRRVLIGALALSGLALAVAGTLLLAGVVSID